MMFTEPVRLLRAQGFELRRQKGSKRFYGKAGFPGLIQVDFLGTTAATCPVGTVGPGTRRFRPN